MIIDCSEICENPHHENWLNFFNKNTGTVTWCICFQTEIEIEN
jgi:hypothetical protein